MKQFLLKKKLSQTQYHCQIKMATSFNRSNKAQNKHRRNFSSSLSPTKQRAKDRKSHPKIYTKLDVKLKELNHQ